MQSVQVSLINDTLTVELPNGHQTHFPAFQASRIVQILRDLSQPSAPADWRAEFQRKAADPDWERRIREAGAKARAKQEARAKAKAAKHISTRGLL
jgi:hypothetical protein